VGARRPTHGVVIADRKQAGRPLVAGASVPSSVASLLLAKMLPRIERRQRKGWGGRLWALDRGRHGPTICRPDALLTRAVNAGDEPVRVKPCGRLA